MAPTTERDLVGELRREIDRMEAVLCDLGLVPPQRPQRPELTLVRDDTEADDGD